MPEIFKKTVVHINEVSLTSKNHSTVAAATMKSFGETAFLLLIFSFLKVQGKPNSHFTTS